MSIARTFRLGGSPGPTFTPMMASVETADMRRERKTRVSRCRLAAPQDPTYAVLLSVSDPNDSVCGIPVDVDGGRLLGWHAVESYRIKRREREVTKGG